MKTVEECEEKIGELELQIEEMEKTNSIVYGIFFGVLSYMQWHSWLLSLVITIVAYLVVWKFIAKRPFTKGLKVEKEESTQDDK